MYSTKNIIQNAMNSKDHTTLVTAVKAAGLLDTLQGKGPFTVFAPTNEAFEKLPAGTVDTLLKPENKEKLAPSSRIMWCRGNSRGQARQENHSGRRIRAVDDCQRRETHGKDDGRFDRVD